MKKDLIVFIAILASLFAVVMISCKKQSNVALTAADINGAAGAGTPTMTATATTGAVCPAQPTVTGLLDDCNDGDNANMIPSPCGPGYWYTFDDGNNAGDSYAVPMSDVWAGNHGIATAPFYMQHPGSDGAGGDSAVGYAARMTGYVTTTFQYGFIGLGNTLINPKAPVDIWTGNSKIVFWEKGDGNTYRMKISSNYSLFTSGNGDDFFGYVFVSTASWSQVTVAFSDPLFRREGWGSNVGTITMQNNLQWATDIQWQTTAHPMASVDLSVDDVQFLP
jgi:hypothetical protein